MKSLFLTAPCLLIVLTTGLFTSDTFRTVNTSRNYSAGTFCVFVIDIDLRNTQENVENAANWRYLGDISENIPSCGPGQLQACQLIVDVRDTELSKDGSRILKPNVIISAMLNKKAAVWYVSDYTPIGSYLYEVLNEEDEID